MLLSVWDKLWILTSAGIIVILTVIIVSCFAGPGCWGFEYLLKREKKKKLMDEVIGKSPTPLGKAITQHTCESGGNFWTDDQGLLVYRTEFYNLGSEKTVKSEKSAVCQPTESIFNFKRAPLLNGRHIFPKLENSFPKLKIKLIYSSLKSNELMGRLMVHIMSAVSLPHREYVSTLDPYVSLSITQGKWPFQKHNKTVHTVQTRVMKNSSNPEFDQTFTFDGLRRDIQNWCLNFTLLDNDRLTRVTPLFEQRLYIRDLKALTIDGSVSINMNMEKTPKNIGNLLFGIRYLPTAQRFNINVIKAAKLKYQGHVSSLLEFYPFVRVVMLNNHGKCIKKKKTCFRQGEFSPIFNQTFIFDLSIANLEQTVFLILLCTKTMHQMMNSEMSDTASIDSEMSLKESREKVLGMIVLGRNVKCIRARNHWVSVMQNPRKMISVWHELR